jgi:hypothetical protein
MSGRPQGQGRGKGGTFKPVKGSGKGDGQGRVQSGDGLKSGTKSQVPPKSQSNRFAPLASAEGDNDMDCEAEEDSAAALKAERKAVVQQLESKLGKIRRAKKSLEDEEDLDSVQGLLENHAQVEKDLESKLLQARANYQELRPAEVKLQQAERDLDITRRKLKATDDELQQVEDTLVKTTARKTRLQEQREQQVAKISRLEAAAKTHHASMGGTSAGGQSAEQVSSSAASPTSPAPSVVQSAEYLALQQQVTKLQSELQEAMAALAVSRPPAQKRERDGTPEGSEAEIAPAAKK